MNIVSKWQIEDNFGVLVEEFEGTMREARNRLQNAVEDCDNEGDLPYHLSEFNELEGWTHDRSQGGYIE